MIMERAAEDGDFYGLPRDSVSSSNAGGKCVTAGETAPCRTVKQKSESQLDQLLVPDGVAMG
jgi:hypothetical protein